MALFDSMMNKISLFQNLQSLMTPDFIEKVSRLIGESPDGIRTHLKSIAPSLLMGISQKGSTQQGAHQLMETIQEEGYDAGVPSDFLTHLTGGSHTERYLKKGTALLSELFGSHLGPLTNHHAVNSEEKSKASRLLAYLAPLAMGVIGSQVKKNGWNASQLSRFLTEQMHGLRTLLPSGLTRYFESLPQEKMQKEEMQKSSLASTSTSEFIPDAKSTGYGHQGPPQRHSSRLVPLALLALFGLGTLFFLKNRGREQIQQAGTVIQQQAPALPQVNIPPVKPLHSNTPLAKSESARTLVETLEVQNDVPLPQKIPLETLKFETGSAELGQQSEEELSEIAIVLRDHPNAQVTVIGATDSTGNHENNMRLSEDRSVAVKNALVDKGVPSVQIDTIGIAEKTPIDSNQNPEGRSENRRAELLLTRR